MKLAADVHGVELLALPEGFSDLVIVEQNARFTFPHLSNPNFTVERLGLDVSDTARYTIIEDTPDDFIDMNFFDANGETVRIPSPFNQNSIKMCGHKQFTNKFSREEWERVEKAFGNLAQKGYEVTAAKQLGTLAERNFYLKVVGGAAAYNQGNDAGYASAGIKLGDAVNPIYVGVREDAKVTDFKATAMDVVSRLAVVMSETESPVGNNQLRIACSHRFAQKLRQEQSHTVIHGDVIKNCPAISGMLLPTYGLTALETNFIPKVVRNNKVIEYVLLLNPDVIAAPNALGYFEVAKILHDVYMYGSYRYGAQVLSAKGVAIAAVTFDE